MPQMLDSSESSSSLDAKEITRKSQFTSAFVDILPSLSKSLLSNQPFFIQRWRKTIATQKERLSRCDHRRPKIQNRKHLHLLYRDVRTDSWEYLKAGFKAWPYLESWPHKSVIQWADQGPCKEFLRDYDLMGWVGKGSE